MAEKLVFPWPYQYINGGHLGGHVVLFESVSAGKVVSRGRSRYKLGSYSENWIDCSKHDAWYRLEPEAAVLYLPKQFEMQPQGQPIGSILLKAHDLVNGDRAQAYGDAGTNFQRWADILRPLGIVLTPYQLALVMVAGKLARQTHKPKEDNLVDAAGYLEIAHRLQEK